MPESRFVAKLAEQIAYEFGASQQYIAIAVHYDDETLPRLAAFFYRQAIEERNHAMMMVQYLLDAGEQFMQWFIKEQVEEVSSMSDLLRVVERARENPLLAEEYLAREATAEAEDATAPAAAGGAI